MNPKSGGAERTIDEIGKRLVSYGHEVHLFSVNWKGGPNESIYNGVKIHRVPGNIYSHLLHRKILRRYKDANVIIDDLGHVVPYASERLINIPGVALFRHLHARTLVGQVNRFEGAVLKLLEKEYGWFYPRWRFITESETPAKDLEKLGIGRDRITVILPGVDHEKFVPSNERIPGQLIYFAGMRRYKRADHAILAFKKISGSYDLNLIMVGNGPCYDNLRKLTNDLGISNRVIFTGKLNDLDLARTISKSYVNIHSSIEEGWCYSPLEAAASGVPTAAYYNEGMSDEIINGVTGSFAKDGDPDALALSIINVLENFKEYSRNAYEFSKRFSWDSSAKKWEYFLIHVSESNIN